ncbi:14037_t:CDS:2 [Funneliformis geosporum]|uniref:10863_t:CDS:1 n=1 Tax=Funneliformis geosporum TaxID=1117311 RepID=A0A9W4SN74_9GLOM|nr:14037_t:CDS:2 [Funneliformis geosporum]CAI2175280.1 10863_t:CDS:2 [Funneliformis geosporum]
MEPIDENSAQSSAPSESLHTVPIYNLDASSSDSDSDDQGRMGGPPVGPPIDTSILSPSIPQTSQRQRQVPQRPYASMPRHERQLSELSAVAESVQTRPSVDEDYLFDEDSTSEEEPFQPNPISGRLSSQTEMTPQSVASPITQYESHTVADVPITSSRTDNRGLRPLSLLGGLEPSRGLNADVEKGLSLHTKEITSSEPKPRGITKETASTEHPSDTGGYRRSRDAEHMYHHRESSDLLPLTLVSGGGALSFSSHYAYLPPPFGQVITRSQIMARVAWFSQLVIFNIIYAGYKLSSSEQLVEGKNSSFDLIGLVIIPLIFLITYILVVTLWTYIDLRNKEYYPSFTVLYYSPLMIFSIFFGEKKRVDVSKFHEVNYGEKWWRFGATCVRESLIMSFYCLFVIGFVTYDIVGRAFNQRNAEVSKVFEDFVPFLLLLVVFSLGFVLSIWTVIENIVAGSMHGSSEGKKSLVGVLPNALKTKNL